MRRLRSIWEWSLGTKLALTFLLVVTGVAVLVSVSVIRRGRSALDEELRERGANLAQNLAKLSVDPVLQDDLWTLYKVVRDMATGGSERRNVVAYAMVLDTEGRVLAHSDPARFPMSEPLRHDPVGRPAGPGRSVFSVELDREQTIHDAAAPIVVDKQTIGVARVGVSTRELEATIGRMTRDVLVVTASLAGVGVALGYVISRRMTRPLRDLSHAVDRIAEGRLDEPPVVHTREKDEIGRLADRFNVMTQRLRDNVREIQETKQYLENLLENANDFIYTLDLEGRITYVNRRFLELGLRKEALVGRPLDALVIRPAPGASVTASDPVIEMEIKGADGERRTLVIGESPLLDDAGSRIGTLGIAKDVSERKQLEARLINSERLASVGELAGALAHELRNPLGSLVAASKMLGANSPQAASYDRAALLQVIIEEGRRLDGILADFLSFARPRAPQPRLASVNTLVTEVIESLRLDDVAAGKSIRTAFDGGLPAVAVDVDQIKQAVWNVIRNGLEASPAGRALSVTTMAVDGHVTVEVTDEGAGIPAEHRARLFEPFHTTKPRGTGLGLAIAHRIVTAHGGAIDVISSSGRGTSVRIRLPREDGA
jgi:PAS domain S-box-containing protein